jgi:hypothetical protein
MAPGGLACTGVARAKAPYLSEWLFTGLKAALPPWGARDARAPCKDRPGATGVHPPSTHICATRMWGTSGGVVIGVLRCGLSRSAPSRLLRMTIEKKRRASLRYAQDDRGLGARSGEEGVFVAAETADFPGNLHGDADLVSQQFVQGLEPENLAAEDEAEVAGDGLGDIVH